MGTVVATAGIASQPAHPGPSLSADNSISINCVRSSSSGGGRGLIRKLADDLSLYILRIAEQQKTGKVIAYWDLIGERDAESIKSRSTDCEEPTRHASKAAQHDLGLRGQVIIINSRRGRRRRHKALYSTVLPPPVPIHSHAFVPISSVYCFPSSSWMKNDPAKW